MYHYCNGLFNCLLERQSDKHIDRHPDRLTQRRRLNGWWHIQQTRQIALYVSKKLFTNIVHFCRILIRYLFRNLVDTPFVFSEIEELFSHNCRKWGIYSHPIDYAVDSDTSTSWLSRSGLPSVDLLFDLRRMYKVSITSHMWGAMIFTPCGKISHTG